MMQAPDIGGTILHHTSDAHEIELPFAEWTHWKPIEPGAAPVDVLRSRCHCN